jgi:16S rRNA processing protein RimM
VTQVGEDTVEVLVGIVGRPHGIRGEVSVDLRTDEPERRFAAQRQLRVEDTERRLTVSASRASNGRFLVSFAGVEDRTAAEAVRGLRLVVDVVAAERPAQEGEFYDRQLIGLAVLDAAGVRRGVVTAVLHRSAQDLLEITTVAGPRLIPFVAALVPEVDLAAREVRLADVPGLLSDAEVD